MKKWFCLILSILFCIGLLLPAAAEEAGAEEDNTGEVYVVDPAELVEIVAGEDADSVEPSVPDDVQRYTFHGDSRVSVNVRDFPFCAIAYIEAVGSCGDCWSGSGFVAGKYGNTVITAAHCLVCPDHGKWAKELTFYFGYKNKKNYMHKYKGPWYAWVGNTFSNREYSYDGDWGVVKLKNENISSKVGGFGMYYWKDSEVPSKLVYAAGYSDQSLQKDSGFMSVMDSNHFKYEIDQIEGDSGGPIFTKDGYAVGIIIGGTSRNGVPLYNVGYRFTWDIANAIDAVQ